MLTHEYFGVDLEIVWRIIEDDLPVLMEAIREIVRADSNSQQSELDQPKQPK